MKSTPIIFSEHSILGIRKKLKSQTRRVIRDELASVIVINHDGVPCISKNGVLRPATESCPYGGIGDRLWVKETHCFYKTVVSGIESDWRVGYKANGYTTIEDFKRDTLERMNRMVNCTEVIVKGNRWRSPRFMPYWVHRIDLEITNIRVQRVQDITEEDAIAEGVNNIEEYRNLWNALNASRGHGFDKNDWVWCISHKEF